MRFEVIDNFLDDNDFLSLQETMSDHFFPWYFNEYSIKYAEAENDPYDFQFLHIFYQMNEELGHLEVNSEKCDILNPVLKKLDCLHLIRAKANLRTIYKDEQENHPHYFHTDQWHPTWQIPTITAIFYINTNNGYTVFKDNQEKVGCVANRLVKFDTRMEHSAVGSTDSKTRIVINFNYIERKHG